MLLHIRSLTLIYIKTVSGEPNVAILHNVHIQVLLKRHSLYVICYLYVCMFYVNSIFHIFTNEFTSVSLFIDI